MNRSPPAAQAYRNGSSRTALVLFWSACVLAFVMALIPHPPKLPGSPSDKFEHIVAFLLLAVLGRWAYPDVRKRNLLVGLAAFGALIELAQSIPGLNRDSDPLDWLADVAAALAVFVAIAAWGYVTRRRRRSTRPPADRP
jgi:peptidoglycan/LPS O-acetylase OafA/YrhL